MVHSANNQPLDFLIKLKNLPQASHYYVAFSGGIDSTVLLHGLCQHPELAGKLSAIHVNHNIHLNAQLWQDHCVSFCQQLQVPLITVSVNLDDHSEAACRQARQQVFKKYLKSSDCLLTGHHLNDDIETILFRLFRGTGLKGMTGIPNNNVIDHYNIHRPLLSLHRKDIESYAQTEQLSFIQDPSNLDNHYSRNHIRNLILPQLLQYDSNIFERVRHTAENLNHSLQLINAMIGVQNPLNFKTFVTTEHLSSALYHWLDNLKLQAPHRKRLLQFSRDCIQASDDKNPQLDVTTYRLIRWKGHIYALAPNDYFEPIECGIELTSTALEIALEGNGRIEFKAKEPVTISATIKYQQSHEPIRLTDSGQHKKLKTLFQQHSIPPWERMRLPYLYIDNKLMAVGCEFFSAEFKQLLQTYKAEYRWLSPQFIL